MIYDYLDDADALARIDSLRAEIDEMRPIEAEQMGRAMQRLRLEWTYHSNAIEGNTLTYGETRALLLHGVTAQGKPLKDHLDIRGHREALDYLERFVQSDEVLTLASIRELHSILLGDEPYEVKAETPEGEFVRKKIEPGQFKTLPNHVRTATGEIHYYATPEETGALMTDLMEWYRDTWPKIEQREVHAVQFAADFHHRFVVIHPFDDGNGRMARLLMNLFLMRAGYTPAVLRVENRDTLYLSALAQADAEDLGPFVRYVVDELATTMELFLRAVRGEPEPEEFDRQIAILKREAETLAKVDVSLTAQIADKIRHAFAVPFILQVQREAEKLSALFHNITRTVQIVAPPPPPSLVMTYGDLEFDTACKRVGGHEWGEITVTWNLSGYHIPMASIFFSVRMVFTQRHFLVETTIGRTHSTPIRKSYREDFDEAQVSEIVAQLMRSVVAFIGQAHEQAAAKVRSALDDL